MRDPKEKYFSKENVRKMQGEIEHGLNLDRYSNIIKQSSVEDYFLITNFFRTEKFLSEGFHCTPKNPNENIAGINIVCTKGKGNYEVIETLYKEDAPKKNRDKGSLWFRW